MSTYSAGLLNVGTLNANGASGSVQATVANVTNLTAANVNATNFSFDNDLTITGDFTVNGSTNLQNLTANSISFSKPNIVMMLVDDLPYNVLSSYGGAKLTSQDIPSDASNYGFKAGDVLISTPNIDAIAAGGLKFMNMFNQGTCSPTRATLQTGMYPSDVGSTNIRVISQQYFSEPIGDFNLRTYEGQLLKENNTLGELAKAGGYDTIFGGKWHLGDMAQIIGHFDRNGNKLQNYSEYPVSRGYDYWVAGFNGGAMSVLNPMKIAPANLATYGEGDYVRDPSPNAGNVPRPTAKWNRYVLPSRPLTATGLATNDSATLPLFNRITDTSFFKIGSNFPFIPQTAGSPGNLDGSGFKYHHNEDMIYATIDRLDKRADKTKPFFACLNFASVHDPVQELPYYIRKFWTNWPAEPTEKTCVFMNIGWDRYREITLAAQIENGTIKNGAPLPPRSENINPWYNLTYADKVINSKSMAIIAAMLVHIDDSVGQFVKYLKDNNMFNNTMLMFMSDNGGAGNFSEFAQTFASSGGNGNWGVAKYDASSNPNGYQEGDENSFLIPGWGWASVMGYPFRMIKSYPEKGGVQTPFVLSWPNGIPSQRNGGNVEHYCWLEDIFPTMFDIVKPVQDPVDSTNATRFNLNKKRVIYNTSEVVPPPTGNPYVNYVATLPSIKGTSLLPFIRGDSPSVQIYRPNPEVSDLCVICGTSVTFGNWQIIRNWGLKALNESYEPYGVWRLYNTITDPYQTTDLASEYPEKYKEMKGYFIDFCRTQSVPESASADTYKIASFIGTYNNKLTNMLDTYIKDQLYLDGSGSFLLPALPPPAGGWRFKGAADTSGGVNGAHQYIPDGTAFIPKQTIPNALKAAPIKYGRIPVVNDGSAQGMYAGNAIAKGRLSDPHYQSTILLSNSGAFGVARGWDGSYNREFPTIPALTYFYDDALRIVLYPNPGMLFFDSSGMSGGIGINGSYNGFAGVTDPSNSFYDPLASTDASGVCYGRARLVYDLPYAELVDRTERGYYVGDGANPYDPYNRFQFDSSGTGFSLDSSNNRVVCNAAGIRSPSPSRVTKRVINLITGCSNLGGENETLSKNYYFSTSQAAASSLGIAIRFKVDSSNNLDINTSLNYGSMVDQSWGFPAVPGIPITPNNSRLTTFYGLVQPSQYPGTTTDSRIINYVEPANSIIKFKGNVNYLTYHTDRQNIPAFVTARLTVGNAVEGIWSGMYGCDYTCYFNSNVPYNAYVSAGFKLDRNSAHDYFPGDILQLPYASGVAVTAPPALAAVYRGRGVI